MAEADELVMNELTELRCKKVCGNISPGALRSAQPCRKGFRNVLSTGGVIMSVPYIP